MDTLGHNFHTQVINMIVYMFSIGPNSETPKNSSYMVFADITVIAK